MAVNMPAFLWWTEAGANASVIAIRAIRAIRVATTFMLGIGGCFQEGIVSTVLIILFLRGRR